jgi:hypothetical protein
VTDTATPTTTKPTEPALTVVLEEAGADFAPRTRKSTADALASLKPSLDAVQSNPDKVYTIVKDITPQRAAALVSLLNERYSRDWTFGGRSADDGKTAIVQARFSTKPELARPLRKPNAKTAATNGAAKAKVPARK